MPDVDWRTFEWKRAFSVGNAEIDGEHRSIYELAEKLQLAMLEGRGRAALDELIPALCRFIEVHLSHEEELMVSAGFPGIAGHRRAHAQLRTAVAGFQGRYQAGEETLTIELMTFLARWLTEHTSGEDLALAQYLSSH